MVTHNMPNVHHNMYAEIFRLSVSEVVVNRTYINAPLFLLVRDMQCKFEIQRGMKLEFSADLTSSVFTLSYHDLFYYWCCVR